MKFSNPGRFMEVFDPDQSQLEMCKVQRCLCRDWHRFAPVFNDESVGLSNGADVCDCLVTDCPGYHFPCPRCSLPKCGGNAAETGAGSIWR